MRDFHVDLNAQMTSTMCSVENGGRYDKFKGVYLPGHRFCLNGKEKHRLMTFFHRHS